MLRFQNSNESVNLEIMICWKYVGLTYKSSVYRVIEKDGRDLKPL